MTQLQGVGLPLNSPNLILHKNYQQKESHEIKKNGGES
ncbi:hypothetical protein HPHPH29_0788 [Helicobacter pylori Hp H-29]|nr:hypothetical protein HPHPH29_0788 [Helicobacter pylori Hp H-29]